MPTKTSLSIKTKSYLDPNKTVTDSISYVNPDISNETALEFSQRMAALSKNSYNSTNRIDTTELDESKVARTLTSLRVTGNTNTTVNVTINDQDVYEVSFPVSGLPTSDPTINIWAKSTSTFKTMNIIPKVESTLDINTISWRGPQNTVGGWQSSWVIYLKCTREAQSFTATITFPADDTYASRTLTFNITITEEG